MNRRRKRNRGNVVGFIEVEVIVLRPGIRNYADGGDGFQEGIQVMPYVGGQAGAGNTVMN
jgi:hypothetical protein